MISINNATLRYPDGTLALNGINLHIRPGELVYITGPSGSGKTSLLKLLMGMEYPTDGTVEVLGCSISKRESGSIRKLRTRIGPVFQEFRLLKGKTALENVILGMRFIDIPSANWKTDAENVLRKVGLGHKIRSKVENLSWGECQRVAIARAVVRKPALILADEPTGNLDKENAENILRLLSSFHDSQTTVVITTHASHLIEGQSNCMYVHIDSGSLRWERVDDI